MVEALTADPWLVELETTGALQRGHFRLSSGLHSPAYVQCARMLEDPARARRAGQALAKRLSPYHPVSILSPALGGLIIGHEVAASLGVPFRFCERKDGAMTLRRGFAVGSGEAVAVVEDVVTTGISTRETIALAEALGARVVAVGALLDRSGGRASDLFQAPFHALTELELPTHSPESCPLCIASVPVDKPGSRPG